MSRKLVQFGAGNIGRSFIGQLFSRGGYEVVFVDIDPKLVDLLNQHRKYRVMIKRSEGVDEELSVTNVRAVNGQNREAVAEEVADASLVATSVGKNALSGIMKPIAEGLLLRQDRRPGMPIDIVIAENMRHAAHYFQTALGALLPENYPFAELTGLVETSIGKMVPIMTPEDLAKDPLWVFAEEYNTLIVAESGFRGPLPELPGIMPVANIEAYVDRKLFLHNLGHAAAAYLGYAKFPDQTYIWETLEDPEVEMRVRAAMNEAAAALAAEYPGTFGPRALGEYTEDLLDRFRNRALGDTIYRVGRDLRRKLGRNDRLIGAMLLAGKHHLPCTMIAETAAAAMRFRKSDERGRMFPEDRSFAEEDFPRGREYILKEVCGLDPAHASEAKIFDLLLQASARE